MRRQHDMAAAGLLAGVAVGAPAGVQLAPLAQSPVASAQVLTCACAGIDDSAASNFAVVVSKHARICSLSAKQHAYSKQVGSEALPLRS